MWMDFCSSLQPKHSCFHLDRVIKAPDESDDADDVATSAV